MLEGNRTENTRSSGIGVWGSRSVVVRGNEIVRACHGGSQESLTIAGTDTFVVENNVICDTGPEKEGIDAKDGSSHGVIRGNRVSNVRVVNNVVTDGTWVGIAVARNGHAAAAHPLADIVIANNTVWRNGDTWGGGIAVDNPEAEAVVVSNNIVSDNRSFQLSLSADVPPSNAIIEYNLVDGCRGDRDDGETYGDLPVDGTAGFVDAAGGDFRLSEGSAAIDAGSPAGAPSTDFGGSVRPQGPATTSARSSTRPPARWSSPCGGCRRVSPHTRRDAGR